jgi:predicted ArsR family transcriptional regulator
MILSDIKQYLSQRGSATLADISMHFDTDPDAMRGMLEQWIRKGRVTKHATSSTCSSSCNKCGSDSAELYQWVESTNNSFRNIAIKSE